MYVYFTYVNIMHSNSFGEALDPSEVVTTQIYPKDVIKSCEDITSYSEEEHTEVPIGEDHQAKIPEVTCQTDNSTDELVWSPYVHHEVHLESFLTTVHINKGNVNISSTIPDDELALETLAKSNYNVESALMQLPLQHHMCNFTTEEREYMEHGLRIYGKNFHKIQKHCVQTKTVPQIIQYYYKWKQNCKTTADSMPYKKNRFYSIREYIRERHQQTNSLMFTDNKLDNQIAGTITSAGGDFNSVPQPSVPANSKSLIYSSQDSLPELVMSDSGCSFISEDCIYRPISCEPLSESLNEKLDEVSEVILSDSNSTFPENSLDSDSIQCEFERLDDTSFESVISLISSPEFVPSISDGFNCHTNVSTSPNTL